MSEVAAKRQKLSEEDFLNEVLGVDDHAEVRAVNSAAASTIREFNFILLDDKLASLAYRL